MRIIIDTAHKYDILLFALTAVEPSKTDATHGMYKLCNGAHFFVDEELQISQYEEAE